MRTGAKRSPAFVILLAIVTCGLYIIYWYFTTLDELIAAGYSPTGNSPIIDFLLVVVTCGIYGIYMDYRIAKSLVEMQEALNLRINDTTTVVILLDVFGLGVIGSAVQQSELNRIWDAAGAR